MPAPLLPADHRRESVLGAVRANLGLLLFLAAIPWAVEILDLLLAGSLDRFGIRPRQLAALPGIAASPFLHGGFGHLASNTLPFLALGGIVLLGGRSLFLTATAVILLLGGGALWVFGPGGTNHIGASLLVFGYLGFLLARGFVERSLAWILVAIAVLILYGGMVGGVLPGKPGVSWQGHLAGFLAGLFTARILFARASPKREGDMDG